LPSGTIRPVPTRADGKVPIRALVRIQESAVALLLDCMKVRPPNVSRPQVSYEPSLCRVGLWRPGHDAEIPVGSVMCIQESTKKPKKHYGKARSATDP
jgi:hypothetical protein